MDFDTWLTQRLLELKTDEAVFGPYIKSIVEGDDDDEEDKIEALDGILAELGDPSLDVESLRKEILSRWVNQVELTKSAIKESGRGNFDSFLVPNKNECTSKPDSLIQRDGSSLDAQLEQLLRLSPEKLVGEATSSKGSNNNTNSAPPDSDLRAAILKQYLHDETDSDDEESNAASGLSKNTNAERVLFDQKEQKEKQKAESAKKREKDREDRAKQKKLAEEKKEKAKKKTAKVERKR